MDAAEIGGAVGEAVGAELLDQVDLHRDPLNSGELPGLGADPDGDRRRRRGLESARNLLLIGIGPVLGAFMLAWLLVLSVRGMSDPENSYSRQAWLGVGPPLVIGVGILLAGIVVMVTWRIRDGRFWQERAGVADPDVVHGVKAAAADRDGPEG